MSIHYSFIKHLDHRVYALAALLTYQLPRNAELSALRVSRDIVWC